MKPKKVEAFECTNCGKVHKDRHEAQRCCYCLVCHKPKNCPGPGIYCEKCTLLNELQAAQMRLSQANECMYQVKARARREGYVFVAVKDPETKARKWSCVPMSAAKK
jgi:hypothetical protein